MKKTKIDRKEIIIHHTPTTDILKKVEKAKPEERIIVSCNPAMAKDLLTLNDPGQNRYIVEKQILLYVREMKTNNWKYTGDPIRISKSGKLIDGQHRLWAIVDSGTTQKIAIECGLDDDTFSYIDIGKNRSAADILSINNFSTNQKQLGYAVKNILYYQYHSKLGSSISSSIISNQMVNKFSRSKTKMAELNEFYRMAVADWTESCKFFTAPQWAVIVYILHNLQWHTDKGPKRVFNFITQLVEGAELSREDPIFKLRKILENFDEQILVKQRRKIGNNIFAAKVKYVFNAWDRYIKRETGGQLDPDLDKIEIPKPRTGNL